MNEAARARWDDGRREPAPPRGREASDPLAELARLVGQDDPYRRVFHPAPATTEAPDHAGYADHAGHGAEPAGDWHEDGEAAYHEGHPAEPQAWAEHGEYDDEHAYADDERYYAVEAASHRDDAGIAEARTAVDGAEASIPDLWARGDAAGHGTAPEIQPSYDPASGRTRERGTARRPILVLAAVLVLTGGGLGASFLAKGGASGAATTATVNGAPTILAATGPTKIKQDDPSATAPEDKDAALLNKGAGAAAGPAKVVQSEEQPADLGQLPKADDGAAMAQSQTDTQPFFPEAKKVKTFVVHPDGTPLYDDGQAVASAAPPPPAAATPKAAGKGVATPLTATIASLVADAPPPTAADSTPAATTSKPARAKPTPPAAAAGAGGFGLQLAASPSEAEAHAAFAKLKKKYPTELGSLTANVHQSETGGKPVYRVRVGGMSREEASALCSKLMAGGGSCFVVHD